MDFGCYQASGPESGGGGEAGGASVPLNVCAGASREQQPCDERCLQLAALVEANPELVGLANSDSTVIFLNGSGRNLVGLDPSDQAVSVPFESFFSHETAGLLREQILPAVDAAGAWEGEAQFRSAGAEGPIPVHLVVFAVKEPSGRPRRLLGITARPIGERLKAEARLRHAQKMEAIGQLAAGVAHDFNNILTVVQGYTSLLLTSGRLGQEDTEALTQVFNASERAAHLTRQLLTFSRKQLMQPRAIDLNDLVAGASRMVNRLIGDSIGLQLCCSTQLPFVKADATMIEQVIMSLAVNARDAMPEGGTLTIRTHTVQLDAEDLRTRPEARPGSFVCLTMVDTGCGMEPAVLDRIFEPFYTTKEVGKGTGLGLPTVYGIVKQHQGWIEVLSKPGEGSTFTIYLPAYEGPASAGAT